MTDPTATSLFGVPLSNSSFNPAVAMPTNMSVSAPASKKRSGINNVLGFLGDFLMSRFRMGTPYRDARQAEKLNEARLADLNDPSQSYANVGNIDPTLAATLQGRAVDDRRLAAAQEATEEAKAARISLDRQKIRDGVFDRAAGYFNTLASDPKDIENRYAAGRQLWQNSSVVKSDPELLQELNDLYPEKFDPAMITSSIGSRVPVSTQWSQRLQANRDAATDVDRDASRGERIRHNKVTEDQGNARIGIAQGRAAVAARRAASGPAPRRATNIQSYVGEDGFKYTQRTDGSVVKSTAKVRERAAAPAEGTRRQFEGKIYEIRGGKPVRVQ